MMKSLTKTKEKILLLQQFIPTKTKRCDYHVRVLLLSFRNTPVSKSFLKEGSYKAPIIINFKLKNAIEINTKRGELYARCGKNFK
ncbi:MAG: hypothetical protein KKE39_14575 [Bacteroidetes bacterium]|nr:hypothetical protein [Bacteroidota bacterium]MBU1373356.1 hypothetical protein [Bacteroidota bacterium]MBU1484447.1 hypothetical protein [Bacteroidota bacterium]MBU1759920.1 hypothetical protein [Bacteroidota bacterium]MBU2046153.1 hypothetical protein [Bacteroidota bacterium]